MNRNRIGQALIRYKLNATHPIPAYPQKALAIISSLLTVNRRATTLAGTVLAAMLFVLTACASGNHGGGSETAKPTSGATSSSAAPGSANPNPDDQLALQLLDAIIRGDFAEVTAHFDSTMREKLTPQQLESAWAEYQQYLGNYQSHGEPQDVPRASLTVVNVPLQMCREPGQFRVTFHHDQTVAGLFFLRAGVPVP